MSTPTQDVVVQNDEPERPEGKKQGRNFEKPRFLPFLLYKISIFFSLEGSGANGDFANVSSFTGHVVVGCRSVKKNILIIYKVKRRHLPALNRQPQLAIEESRPAPALL